MAQRVTITAKAGRSPFGFDGIDAKGRRRHVWILDAEGTVARLRGGPFTILIEDWQDILRGRSAPDLADVALNGGAMSGR